MDNYAPSYYLLFANFSTLINVSVVMSTDVMVKMCLVKVATWTVLETAVRIVEVQIETLYMPLDVGHSSQY